MIALGGKNKKKSNVSDCEAITDPESEDQDNRKMRARVRADCEFDKEEEETRSYGEAIGECCAWCLVNHTDIPLFFISFLILYLSINRCCYCVVVVAIVSALMCMRFPLLNATLWSALIVLYLHKDWNLNFGNVRVSWNRST